MLICICGKSCSGKSTFAKELIKYCNNAIYVDVDIIGHDVLKKEDVKNKLAQNFGEEIIDNGLVNRKKLGKIVFNSKEAMNILTEITWRYMEIEIDKVINNNKDKLIFLDYILLPITKYFTMADIKIFLDTPYEIRKNRALIRDKITKEEFDLREQASIEYNVSDFNYVIKSDNEERLYYSDIKWLLKNYKL